jgi:hypothetical protein
MTLWKQSDSLTLFDSTMEDNTPVVMLDSANATPQIEKTFDFTIVK